MLRRLRFGRFALLVAALLMLALLVQPALAPADDDNPLDTYLAEQRRAEESKKQLEEEITAGRELKTEYERELVSLDAQLVLLGREISAAETAIGSLNVQIDEATLAIAVATANLNERQAYLESRLLNIYIDGDISLLDVFFSAASFDEFIVLDDMVERIMVQDKEVLDDIATEKANIETEKARLTKIKEDQEFILAELSTKNKELSRVQAAKARANNELTMNIEQLKVKYEEEEAASAEAEQKIKAYLASIPKQAYFGGTFVWPLPGNQTRITSEYGPRNHPILKTELVHAGLDIGAPGGTEIYAAGRGEVIFRGWLGGYGNAIMLDHGGGIVTLYGHMSRFGDYNEGDTVLAYGVIGYVGSTGQSTGNHLHFEVRVNGAHTNPRPYLGI